MGNLDNNEMVNIIDKEVNTVLDYYAPIRKSSMTKDVENDPWITTGI